jgi:hypothetical protein
MNWGNERKSKYMRIKTKDGVRLEIMDGKLIFPTLNTTISLDQIMRDDVDDEFAGEMQDIIKEARMLIKSEGLF